MKTQKLSKALAAFLAVLLLFSLGTTVFADEAPVLSGETSTVETTTDDGTPAPAGTPAPETSTPETSEPESSETPEASASPESSATPEATPAATPEATAMPEASAEPTAEASASPDPAANDGLTTLADEPADTPETGLPFEANDEAKTISIADSTDPGAIQKAIDYIATKEVTSGWTITVGSGTYNRFSIIGINDLTIEGADRNRVVVETLTEAASDGGRDSGGINAFGSNITIRNMTITAGNVKSPSFSAAVSNHDGAVGGAGYSLTVENCTIAGSGLGDAFLFDSPAFTVNYCDISGFEQAIEFYGDNFAADNCNVTNNTIRDCTYAVHGYFGKGVAQKPMTITGNTISGSSDRFAVIAVLDQANSGAVQVDISDNTFSYTIVGGINQEDDVMVSALTSNKMNDHSFVADAYWYAADDYGTRFYAPKEAGKIATWYADPTSGAGSIDAIEGALDDYGTAGQFIEINAPAQEIFTIAKNAIVIAEYVDAGDLKIEKVVPGATESTVDFEFTVKLTREDGRVLNGRYDYIDPDGNTQTVTLENGSFTVAMGAGESITVKDLLPGTKYEVTESENNSYVSSSENAVGSINNDTVTVTFTNTEKEPVPPIEGGDWDVSKSKTATNLDENFESDVTLSLPSAETQLASDVVFVLDKSTSAELEDQALKMLKNLQAQIQETGAKVNVGVVIFNKEAHKNGFFDLATEYDKIEAAIKTDISSGTNTHAGLLAGIDMLESDTSVSDDRKYLIFVSDGITYMYNEEPTAIGLENADKTNIFAGPDNWATKYGNNAAPSNWEDYLGEVQALIARDGEWFDYPYGTPFSKDGENHYVAYDDRTNYAMSIDKALYRTYEAYSQAASKYHCYAMLASTNADHPWATSFMNYLAGGKSVDFDQIQNDIYYLLDAGSTVVDVIGHTDDYNFDFVNDAANLTMTVGGETLKTTKIDDTSYGFGELRDGEYSYVLTYYANGSEDVKDEHFVWQINVPVSNFEPVTLTYTVKLTNPKTEPGTYGQYDKDGSQGYDGLYTNNSATLYPVDSNETPGEPEEFAKPTVSYTVEKTATPTPTPTTEPTPVPSTEPSPAPTTEPTPAPTTEPTTAPTAEPTAAVTPTPAPESSAPQTGDTTNLVMWVVILCIGAACLTVTLVYFRMQKKAGHRR